jgi:hypothetical protein
MTVTVLLWEPVATIRRPSGVTRRVTGSRSTGMGAPTDPLSVAITMTADTTRSDAYRRLPSAETARANG